MDKDRRGLGRGLDVEQQTLDQSAEHSREKHREFTAGGEIGPSNRSSLLSVQFRRHARRLGQRRIAENLESVCSVVSSRTEKPSPLSLQT